MRIAAVVIPVAMIAAAAGLAGLGATLRHQPAATTGGDSCDPTCGVRVSGLPPAQRAAGLASIPPAPTLAPPEYAAPVGAQFLTEWSDLLIAKGDGPPLLLVVGASDLNGRYGWRMPRVARVMAQELASVLDDGCTGGCPAAAQAARAAAHAFTDEDNPTDDPAKPRAWVIDDAGYHTYMRSVAVRSHAGAVTIDVTCTCASSTVGMRMWNDITSCDAMLRERGRVLATYRPRVLARSNKESIDEPIEAWDQTVELPSGTVLVDETGWDYAGDNVTKPLRKTTPRTGPHWR